MVRCPLVNQPIAYASLDEQMAGYLRVSLQLCPELRNDDTKVLHVVSMGRSPNAGKRLAMRDNFVGIEGQQCELVELLGSQVHLSSIHNDMTMFVIQQDFPK